MSYHFFAALDRPATRRRSSRIVSMVLVFAGLVVAQPTMYLSSTDELFGSSTSSLLYSVDAATATTSFVATLPGRGWVVGDGARLFFVSGSGSNFRASNSLTLHAVDPVTGAASHIGSWAKNAGIPAWAGGLTSELTFDWSTGRLYYEVHTTSTNVAIFEVDTTCQPLQATLRWTHNRSTLLFYNSNTDKLLVWIDTPGICGGPAEFSPSATTLPTGATYAHSVCSSQGWKIVTPVGDWFSARLFLRRANGPIPYSGPPNSCSGPTLYTCSTIGSLMPGIPYPANSLAIADPSLQSTGQPNSALASLAINGVGGGTFPGPFPVNLSVGSTATLAWSGPANVSVILYAGPLNVNAAQVSGVGSVDLGTPPIFGDLVTIGNGLMAGAFNSLFVLDGSGTSTLSVSLAGLPPGPVANLQGLVLQPAGASPFAVLTSAFALQLK